MVSISRREGVMEERAPRGGRLQYVSRLKRDDRGDGRDHRHSLWIRPWLHRQRHTLSAPDLDLSTFMVSVVTATVVLGQLFGAFFAGRITNTIGRKRAMVLVALG